MDDSNEESPVADLVLLAVAGDQGSWDELVTRYTPLVLSVVRRHRLWGAEAEDAVQTVWLRLVEHLGDLREPRALPGWIVTTSRHECLRLIRARRLMTPMDLSERPPFDGAEPDPAADLLDAERHEALLAALAELPERQRDLLLLLITDPPIPYGEITRRLDMPIGSIGPTRARALARIRRYPAVSALLEA